MTRDEAERLARATRALMGIERTTLDGVRDGIMMLCNYIISGDHKRQIENAAFERAASVKAIGSLHPSDRASVRHAIHALIQPPAQKENEE